MLYILNIIESSHEGQTTESEGEVKLTTFAGKRIQMTSHLVTGEE